MNKYGIEVKPERRRETSGSSIDYDLIRRTVTAEEIANAYGLEVDRHHRARCPWHSDKHPSMVLYPTDRGGGCYCFVCHNGGSCIDLAMCLLGVDAATAARQIAEDFAIDGAVSDALSVADRLEIARKRAAREAEKAAVEARRQLLRADRDALHEIDMLLRSLSASADEELKKAELLHEAFPPPDDYSLSDALDDPINSAFYEAADRVWDTITFRAGVKTKSFLQDMIEKETIYEHH